MVVTGRQVRVLVQGHTAPRFIGDRKWVQESVGGMAHHLVPLASITAANIALDSNSQPRPLKILGDKGLGAGHTIVTRERRIVVLVQDLQDEGRGGRGNEEATLLIQEASLQGTVLPI